MCVWSGRGRRHGEGVGARVGPDQRVSLQTAHVAEGRVVLADALVLGGDGAALHVDVCAHVRALQQRQLALVPEEGEALARE